MGHLGERCRWGFRSLLTRLLRRAGTRECWLICHLPGTDVPFLFLRWRAGPTAKNCSNYPVCAGRLLGLRVPRAAGAQRSPCGASGSSCRGGGCSQAATPRLGPWHCLGFPSQLNHPFLSLRVRRHHHTQETLTLAKSRGAHKEDNQNNSL